MNLQLAFIGTSRSIGDTLRLKPIVVCVVMLLLISETFGQNWSVNYTPRFRHLNQIHQLGRDIVTMVGGWPQNDSISYMAYTEDGGQLWHFEDIFPGAMLNAAVFFNDGSALAAGYNEKLYKSSNRGRNWTLSSFNLNLNQSNINAMARFGSNTCFAVGGLHHAGGFIIHSADAGETWSMLHQNNETEFVALHILPTGSLLVSGTDSNIFYSDNAAENWQLAQVEPAIDNMQINAFAFVDASTGFCVGGRQGSDSILLIMKTIDGGQNWSEVLRRTDPALNDICFVDQTTLLAVGDYGIILKSVDSGSTWSQYLIEGNPGYHLFSIDFANIHIGAISGQHGLYMLYNDGFLGLPEVSVYPATHVTSSKAELHAMVNAAFNEIDLFFDYGITGGESHTVPMGTFSGGNPEYVNYTVSGLAPDSFYWCRARLNLSNETIYSDTVWFFTGNPIPNWDFEDWSVQTIELLSDWYMLGSFEKASENEFVYVKLLPVDDPLANSRTSAILNGNIVSTSQDESPIVSYQGGAPLMQKPNQLFCRLRYNIHQLDSALVVCIMKKQQEVIAFNHFWITGATGSEFIDTIFNIEYSENEIPDTVILGFAATNPYRDNGLLFDSWMHVESFWFDINTEIPNQEFDQWETLNIEILDSWYYKTMPDFIMANNYTPTVIKTEDAYHNNCAACLQAVRNNGAYYDVEILSNYNNFSFPVNHRHQNIELFYKYYPDVADTADIIIMMLHNNDTIGTGYQIIISEVTNWQRIVIPITYFTNQTPDAACIFIRPSKTEEDLESMLCVDKICFDGDFIPVKTTLQEHYRVYPNPASSNIVIDLQEAESALTYIFDMQGKLQKTVSISKGENTVNIENLQPGIYIIKIEGVPSTRHVKIIIL